MILEKAGYKVCGIARSVPAALDLVEQENPDLVLLDIFLQGNLNGIDLARKLREKSIGFVYLSANSTKKTLDEAKVTRPYGFLVKPFREKDILVMLDIAWYQHEQDLSSKQIREEVLKKSSDPEGIPQFKNMIGNSRILKDVLNTIAFTVWGILVAIVMTFIPRRFRYKNINGHIVLITGGGSGK